MARSMGEAGDEVAWISVHDTVKGKKLRNFAEEMGCSLNEALGLLVGFWLWGLDNVDPDGLIPSAKRKHIANALVEGLDERYSAEKAAEAMISTGWIDDVDGHLYVHDWKQWQKQWYKAMKIRSYDNERKAKGRSEKQAAEVSDKPRDEPQAPNVQSGAVDEEANDSVPKPVKKAKNAYPSGFEEFWGAYPRKTGKGEAYKCYSARLKDGWSPEELLQAARNYAQETARRHTEPQYIKHPKTFLSADTPFTDFLPQRGVPEQQRFDEECPFAEWE